MGTDAQEIAAALQEHCTREALRIWREHAHNYAGAPGMNLMPLLLDTYEVRPDILFVGMNSSFSGVIGEA